METLPRCPAIVNTAVGIFHLSILRCFLQTSSIRESHFYSAETAGEAIGISGHAFRKRATRYGIVAATWPHNRKKYTPEQVEAVKKLGKPPAGNRKGVAHRRMS